MEDPDEVEIGFGGEKIVFNAVALKCLSRSNVIRTICMKILRFSVRLRSTNIPVFDTLVLMAILSNSISMAFFDPVAAVYQVNSSENNTLEDLEWGFQVFFTLEALIKIIALGFAKKPFGYLRDPWNVLDFIIVLFSWIPLIASIIEADSGASNLSSLKLFRTVRVLRPLRVISISPRLRTMVKAIFASFKQIMEILVFFVATLGVFAIIGMALFQGKLRQRCAVMNTGSVWIVPETEMSSFCSFEPEKFGRTCPTGLTCMAMDFNPRENLQSFDNFYSALLTVFQVITKEGWSEIMYGLFDTTYRFYSIYFMLLILFGGYFMLDLIVSSMSINFFMVRQENSEASPMKREASFMDFLVRRAEERQQAYVIFQNLPLEQQVQEMEMRLMMSYEINRHRPYYRTVAADEYEEYSERNILNYPSFREHVLKTWRNTHRGSALYRLAGIFENGIGDPVFSRKESERTGSDEFQDTHSSMHQVYEVQVSMDFGDQAPTRLKSRRSLGSIDANDNDEVVLIDTKSIPESKTPNFRSEMQEFTYLYIVNTNWFDIAVTIVIVLNTILLCTEYFQQPESWTNFLMVSNLFFLAIFTGEVCLRWYAMGTRLYFASKLSIFDVIIVVLGYLELIIGKGGMSAFRAIRVLRVFKLTVKVKSLQFLMISLEATVAELLPFCALFFVFIYIFAILGLNLFGGKFEMPLTVEYQNFNATSNSLVDVYLNPNPAYDCFPNPEQFLIHLNETTDIWHCPNRYNYDGFLQAFVTTFIVITGEDWNGVMFVTVEQTGSYWPVLYFVIIVLFGTFVLLNFFLAILVETFVEQHHDRAIKAKRKEANRVVMDLLEDSPEENRRDSGRELLGIIEKRKKEFKANFSKEDMMSSAAFSHNSVFVIKPENKVRIGCGAIMYNKWFDRLILVTIFFSCVLLILDSPVNPLMSSDTLFILNCVITSIFLIEFFVKVTVLGFARGPGSYLRNPWNLLDFFILVISISDIIATIVANNESIGGLKALRVFRALRPLRSIRRFEGLRVVVKACGKAVIPCFQGFLLCCVAYLAFAISGVSFFMGGLHACFECPVDGSSCYRNYLNATKTCFEYPQYGVTCPVENRCLGFDETGAIEYKWSNPTYGSLFEIQKPEVPYSFDSFFESLQTLFEMSTMEIWAEPMYSAGDMEGIGLNPIRNDTPFSNVFFVVFIFLLQFFMLQVFVAILIDTYLDSMGEESGESFLSKEQKEWVDSNKLLLMRDYQPPSDIMTPKNPIRKRLYMIVENSKFKNFVLLIICLNTVCMVIEYYNMKNTYATVLLVFDLIFGAIYVVEFLLKLVAYFPVAYLKSKKNWLDAIVVAAVIGEWILLATGDTTEVLRAVLALRVFRVFRLFKYVDGMKLLLTTIVITLYPMINILGLMTLFLFVYSILGMQLFGGYDVQDLTFMSDKLNFDDFGNSFIVLFVMSTGENWDGIMHNLKVISPHATWFCISFVFGMQLFLMNLFVAVIMTSFSGEWEKAAQDRAGFKDHFSEKSLKNFNQVWNRLHSGYMDSLKEQARRVAPESEEKMSIFESIAIARRNPMRLPARLFANLILELAPPLGFKNRSTTASFNMNHVMRYVREKHIPVSIDGTIHFHSTLRALVDINVLEGQVPKPLEAFVDEIIVANSRIKLSTDEASDLDMDEILAKVKIESLVSSFAFSWKIKRMKKHGASKETIFKFVEAHFDSQRELDIDSDINVV